MIQKIGLKTQTVKKGQVEKKILVVGHIEYPDSNIYYINSRINGWVEKLYVRSEGQIVQVGKPLFSIYSPELVSA